MTYAASVAPNVKYNLADRSGTRTRIKVAFRRKGDVLSLGACTPTDTTPTGRIAPPFADETDRRRLAPGFSPASKRGHPLRVCPPRRDDRAGPRLALPTRWRGRDERADRSS